MSFVLKQTDSYKWPVSIDIPIDGGKHQRHTFDGEFRRITQSRVREMGQLIDKGELTDVDVVKEVFLGWDGIENEKNEVVPFSVTALSQLLEVPLVATSIATAFFESIAGAKKKLK